jgi:hypothetical protein
VICIGILDIQGYIHIHIDVEYTVDNLKIVGYKCQNMYSYRLLCTLNKVHILNIDW